MKLGDGKLPPFIGYLPPVVDGALLELVNMSYKEFPKREGKTGAQLSQSRILEIDALRVFFKRKPHQRAIEVVATAMREQKSFCLYLRNFGLGPRVYPVRNDPFGLPQVLTLASRQFDLEMQSRIDSAISSRVPALCISNPAGDFGEFPAFIVDDEHWAPLAQTLVRNAGLIVLYFLSLTSGVTVELDLIRCEKKQNSTLVVIEEDDPFEDNVGLDALFEVQRNEPPTVEAPMDDFPNQVKRKGEEGWRPVEDKLTQMAQGQLSAPVDTRVGLPVEFMPPEHLRNFCTDAATAEFDAAMKLIDEKKYEDAEDVLIRSLAYAHWGRDTLGRTVTLVTLGQLSLAGFKAKGDAGRYFEMALDICEGIRTTSPTAAKLYPVIEHELQELRAEAEAKAKAKAVSDRERVP